MEHDPPDAPEQSDAPAQPDATELAVREHIDHQRWVEAADTGIAAYGDELLGFMFTFARNDADADDLFAVLCERIWTKLPTFAMRSSFRTWCYAIARNLVRDESRARERRRGRDVPLSAVPELLQVPAQMRSTTVQHMRSETKQRLEQLRAALEPDDRMLLVLSLDRRLPWREVALVMADEGANDEELARTVVRLRKRFERIKARLREHVLAGAQRES